MAADRFLTGAKQVGALGFFQTAQATVCHGTMSAEFGRIFLPDEHT